MPLFVIGRVQEGKEFGMLKVKASVRPTKRGDLGLFADEFIPKGTPVWEEVPETLFITVKEYFSLSGEERKEAEHFGYPVCHLDEEPKRIGIVVCRDNGRYTSHADDPNSGPVDGRQEDFALRDIAKDEEITCDYRICDPDNILDAMGVRTGKTFLLDRSPLNDKIHTTTLNLPAEGMRKHVKN